MNTLDELLSLKQFRENEAEREVMRSVNALERCEAARDQCEQALDAFRVYAREKELAMYADLCTRTVELGEIEDVQHAVTRLREEEAAHADAVAQARAEEEAARDALAQARTAHLGAVRMTQKFAELVQQSMQEQTRDRAMREEHELDEAGTLGHAHARARGASLMESK
ncbi:MAG TPA: YscO family type III secretion system apparatus protein [Burkholderiaceae bacterium]|jgi:type III secretion protein O|nr:YscO family type III secretion system apparatus protein [Burkholderiaceae bacterium]